MTTRRLTNRYCVVTGATRGIGLASAAALADRGARVMLVGRDARRLADAIDQVARRANAAGAPTPLSHLADLSSKAGVDSLVNALTSANTPIDILLNNAGAFFPDRKTTVDGVERTFALNHLATFGVTVGVIQLLRRSEGARVITVSSRAHRAARSPYDDWQSAQRFTPMSAYARSKLANILFTKGLAKRLEGSTITANCFHPGVVRTGFAEDARGPVGLFFKLARPFMRTPERGAATGIYLATSNDVATVSGEYFADEKREDPSTAAKDEGLAESLWQESEELTGRRLA